MDAKTVIALVSIAISVFSLILSGTLALRQTRATKDGYALPVVLTVFSRFRTQEFFDAQQYVFEELPRQPVQPYTDLPLEARSQIRMVGGLYDDLGKLVAHGIVKEELIIGSNGTQARRIWEAVEPFVRAERDKRASNLWIYLEDLAYRTTRNPPATIHEKLKLREYTGMSRPSVPAPDEAPAPAPAPPPEAPVAPLSGPSPAPPPEATAVPPAASSPTAPPASAEPPEGSAAPAPASSSTSAAEPRPEATPAPPPPSSPAPTPEGSPAPPPPSSPAQPPEAGPAPPPETTPTPLSETIPAPRSPA